MRIGVRAGRRGVTVVEFALTFPVLILLVVGLIEFTRLHNLRHAADNAAYEAARHVIVPGASVSEALSQGKDLLARAGVRSSTITVTPSVITEQTGQVTVRVSVPLAGNSWLPPGLTKSRTVTREATLMTERVPVVQARAVPARPPKPKPPSTGGSKPSGSKPSGGGSKPSGSSRPSGGGGGGGSRPSGGGGSQPSGGGGGGGGGGMRL